MRCSNGGIAANARPAETPDLCPMSRTSTRTKIAVGIGLLVLALVVVALTGSSSHEPEVAMSVASQTSNSVLLSITNNGPRTLDCYPGIGLRGRWRRPDAPVPTFSWFTLAARSSTVMIASATIPWDQQERYAFNVIYVAKQGSMHRVTDHILRIMGCNVADRGGIVSVEVRPAEP